MNRVGGRWLDLPADLEAPFTAVLVNRGSGCPYCTKPLVSFQCSSSSSTCGHSSCYGWMMTNLLTWVADLARTHTRQLAAVAVREGLSGADALDAVQEAFHTFLGLPQGRSLATAREDAERLMTVLVRNTARNMRRRHHRARPHDQWEEVDVASDSPTSDELIAEAEEHIALLGCVSQLGELQRQVVTLRMLEEVAPAEVARELALTPNHVAVLLHRAKQELRECIAFRLH